MATYYDMRRPVIFVILLSIAVACVYAEHRERVPVQTQLGPPEPAIERAAIQRTRRVDSVRLRPSEEREKARILPRRATARIEKRVARIQVTERDSPRETAPEIDSPSAALSVPRAPGRERDTFVDKDKDGYDDTRTEVDDL